MVKRVCPSARQAAAGVTSRPTRVILFPEMVIFQSEVQEAPKKLAKGGFSSSSERDEALATVVQAEGLRARDVVWMVFRPDSAIREAGTGRSRGRCAVTGSDRQLID